MPEEIVITEVVDEITLEPKTYPENFNFAIFSKWLDKVYVKNIILIFDKSSAEVIDNMLCF